MDDRLFAYLQGHLEPGEAAALEGEMLLYPEVAARLDHLRRALAPLAEVESPEPPAGLVLATLTKVAEHIAKPLPAAPRRPYSPMPGRPWRIIEWVLAASILFLVGGLATVWVAQAWRAAHVKGCEQNLASLWFALARYGERNNGALPAVQDVRGAQGVAAAYLPLLFQAGANEPLNVGCPAVGKKPAQPCSLEPLEQLYQEDPVQFRKRVRDLAGDYAYTLGYRDNGLLCGPRLDAGAEVPLLADGPPPFVDGNSRNHGGHGQNVLFVGGHVRWVGTPALGPQQDELFRNRNRLIRAGCDPTDFVLGAGDAIAGP